MIDILTTAARTSAIAHVEWVRGMCEFADVPEFAVEFLERGFTRQDVIDVLHPLVHHGERRLGSGVPFRDLFLGTWRLDDPDLDGVEISE